MHHDLCTFYAGIFVFYRNMNNYIVFQGRIMVVSAMCQLHYSGVIVDFLEKLDGEVPKFFLKTREKYSASS